MIYISEPGGVDLPIIIVVVVLLLLTVLVVVLVVTYIILRRRKTERAHRQRRHRDRPSVHRSGEQPPPFVIYSPEQGAVANGVPMSPPPYLEKVKPNLYCN